MTDDVDEGAWSVGLGLALSAQRSIGTADI